MTDGQAALPKEGREKKNRKRHRAEARKLHLQAFTLLTVPTCGLINTKAANSGTAPFPDTPPAASVTPPAKVRPHFPPPLQLSRQGINCGTK